MPFLGDFRPFSRYFGLISLIFNENWTFVRRSLAHPGPSVQIEISSRIYKDFIHRTYTQPGFFIIGAQEMINDLGKVQVKSILYTCLDAAAIFIIGAQEYTKVRRNKLSERSERYGDIFIYAKKNPRMSQDEPRKI